VAVYACRVGLGEVRDEYERAYFRGQAWTCGEKTADWASIAATVWSENVDAAVVAGWLVGQGEGVEKVFLAAHRPAKAVQASLLRDIFGNPFRPASVNPAWLAWDNGAVVNLARAAYDNRALPAGTLDNARLGILADALEEAGCDNQAILGHLRSPGPHYRGCWPVDLVLAKE
jgi:hypothetical protein